MKRKENRKKERINRKITKLCLFLDLLSQMRTNMYVIHDHKKRERERERGRTCHCFKNNNTNERRKIETTKEAMLN